MKAAGPPVKDLREFIGITDLLDLLTALTVFRGQPLPGNLIPNIARKDPTVDTTEQEKILLRQLRLMGASLLPDASPSQLDLMVLAQHAGLKTRLLDWTSNPLAALWFACSDQRPGDVFVYALEADTLQKDDVYSEDPFAADKTLVFQPRLNNRNAVAQDAWFTLHRYSTSSRRFVSLDANLDMKGKLTDIPISGDSRGEILRSLDRHGINRRTLFPDLEGLCRYLNWKHGLE
jgi:hypothetical protein